MNTPMTFEEWYWSNQTEDESNKPEYEWASMAWEASQAQQEKEIEAIKHDLFSYMEASNGYVNEIMKQSQTIAELVEALDIAKDILEAHTLTHVYDALIAKVKGK